MSVASLVMPATSGAAESSGDAAIWEPEAATSIPEDCPLLEIERHQPFRLVDDRNPVWLRGGVIYRPAETSQRVEANGLLEFSVQRGGVVYLHANTDAEEGSGAWREQLQSEADLISDGWQCVGWSPDGSRSKLYRRVCTAGEEFGIRTRRYESPLLIVTPQIDLTAPEMLGELDPDFVDAIYFAYLTQLLESENYDALDREFARLREEKPVVSSGRTLNHLFCEACARIARPSENRGAELKSQIQRLERWNEAKPESAAARLSLAATLIEYAWVARGSGFANTVTEEGAELFGERLVRAFQLLEPHVGKDNFSIAAFPLMIEVFKGLGGPKEVVLKLAARAVEIDPGPHRIAVELAEYLMPRWHGEPEDEALAAETLVEATREDYGEAIYYLMVHTTYGYHRGDTLEYFGFDWERFKQGFRDLDATFGVSNARLNTTCIMAFDFEDYEFADELFQRIGDRWDRRWSSAERYDNSRKAAAAAASSP